MFSIIKRILRPPYKMLRGGVRNTYFILRGAQLAWCSFRLGERCKIIEDSSLSVLIMGNGPSLEKIDIEAIAASGVEICCVNFFPARDSRFFSIKPKYLCIIDPAFFVKNVGANEKALFSVLADVDWEMNVICLQNQNLPVQNPNLSYIKICSSSFYDEYCPKWFLHFLYRHDLVNCGLQNVILAAAFYFVLKRVKKLMLAGVDMSEFNAYTVDSQNNICCRSPHFYGIQKDQFKSKANGGEWYFHQVLGWYVTMFREFCVLSDFAKSVCVPIVNLSQDSYIDCIEKTEWPDMAMSRND